MSAKVLSATTLALLIGVSTFSLNTAIAQNGSEVRSNEREMKKALDDKHLSPIRPIRRVGEDNWPEAKNQPTTRETTGQSAKQEEPAKQEPAKQDAAKQEPAKQEPAKQDTAKQDTAKPEQAAKPEPKQDTAKQEAPKPDATKPDAAKQETAKQDAVPSSAPESKPETKPQDTAKNADQDNKNNDKGFASIRLGTDTAGRVAVNDAQEKEITRALRKQRVETFNVKVSIGSVAPANVRVVAVSNDIVDVLPQFRGYSYFATREEIVIVEPSTKKVVALVPVALTATASRPSDTRESDTRSIEQRTTTRAETPRTDPRRNETRTSSKQRDVTTGRSARFDDVPSREEILAAPVARGPAGTTVTRTYRSYQHYEPDDDVVIIERRRPRFFGMW